MRAVIGEAFRQRASPRVAPAVGELGLEHPRGTGAEKDSDAPRSVTRGARGDLRREAILGECEGGEAIVAAVELDEFPRQGDLIHTGDLTHAGLEAHRLEVAGGKPRALCTQA